MFFEDLGPQEMIFKKIKTQFHPVSVPSVWLKNRKSFSVESIELSYKLLQCH